MSTTESCSRSGFRIMCAVEDSARASSDAGSLGLREPYSMVPPSVAPQGEVSNPSAFYSIEQLPADQPGQERRGQTP